MGDITTPLPTSAALLATGPPRFPAGLTQYDANGQFRHSSGRIVRERSEVVILLYPVADAQRSSVEIEEIRDIYEKAFEQESVLRADSVDLVSF